MKRILLLAGVALWPLAARAQLSPNWTNGYKPQASEWNTLWSNALDLRTLGQPGSAALLDAAGALSANQVLGTGTSTPVTLANAAVQRLDPIRFGALCNGSTDDQAAFNSIGGYINRASSSLVRTNTAWEIDIAGGRCLLSQPWTIAYGTPNISVHIHGDGSAHSELEWTGGTNGIVVSFAANANGNEMARGTTYAGQGISVDGLHLIAATGSGRAGTALTVNGIPLTNASNPPFQRYSDLVFGNDNGYADNAVNWAGGLYLVNPDNVNARDLMWWDQDHQSNTTSIPFWLHSTAPAGGPGHGNITFDNVTAQGGATGFQIDGNAFQGINISHLFTVFVQTAVSWVANQNTLSGSLTIDHSSLSAQQTIVNLANVSTVFSDDNFYYNTNPPAGHNFYAFSSLGGDTIVSHGDTFVGPAAGAMGAGYTSTAMVVFSPSTFDPQGSVISGDGVSGFDRGYVASGGPISFKDDRAASTTTTCYQDAGTQASSALHPDFDGISCGQTLNKDDGKGLALAFSWTPQRFLNGSLELGLPGVTSPGGVTGYSGQLDFHSVAAATSSALNDYDCRLASYGGVSGTAGLGGLTGTCALGLIMSGQLVDQSAPRVTIAAGGTVQAADSTTGIELAPGATIASGTLALPANPVNDQPFYIGTEQTITAFSLTAPSSTGGVAHYINSAPSTLTAAGPVAFRFQAAVNTWDPIVGAGGGGGSGTPGQAATITAGSATALASTASPTVSNSGTSSAAVFNFGIPAGTPGTNGVSPTVAAGTATALASTASPTVTDSGSGSSHIFNFGIPAGTPGANGGTPTFQIGTVSTLAAGSNATVSDTVSGLQNTLNFGIPQGAAGTGTSASYASPTVLTGAQTLSASMCGLTYQSGDSAAVTYTVPTGLTNCRMSFVQGGTGQITFAGASGVTVNTVGTSPATTGQWATVVLKTLNAANTLVLGTN